VYILWWPRPWVSWWWLYVLTFPREVGGGLFPWSDLDTQSRISMWSKVTTKKLRALQPNSFLMCTRCKNLAPKRSKIDFFFFFGANFLVPFLGGPAFKTLQCEMNVYVRMLNVTYMIIVLKVNRKNLEWEEEMFMWMLHIWQNCSQSK
jgi:hypothetical protein